MKKQLKRVKQILGMTLAIVLLASCARDGRDGRDGFDGFDGRDGVANIDSYTYFVSTTDWTITNFGAEVNVSNPAITADVAETGLVQAYFSLDGNPNSRRWIALPYFDFGYSYVTGITTFEHYDANGSPDDLWYKVVVIPQAAKIDGVNLNDYEAVETIYGLE